MIKFQVAYNGKVLGYENADTEAAALAKLIERNPHHLPERFVLTALEPVVNKGVVIAHRSATNLAEQQKAADRVRSARANAVARQDSTSEAELVEALERFQAISERSA